MSDDVVDHESLARDDVIGSDKKNDVDEYDVNFKAEGDDRNSYTDQSDGGHVAGDRYGMEKDGGRQNEDNNNDVLASRATCDSWIRKRGSDVTS